ncbi:GntP family permease [Maledivibacter halophilus]|uniref:H+/gluconate symporter n=1 Tax=Maledivibacter halophilus TaxID=36842 RepID=A0A1T5IA13_9FIRM|nr:GntP family permease [Maledivibacter halophilus]SKC35900.1 H+/gluconate symporter [Maledivibacter halophilus]
MGGQELVSLIGIIFALTLLIILVMKGVNIFIIAITCSAIVALTGGINLYSALKLDYMEGFVGFFKNNFLIFLTGTLMGKMYEITNGAKAIAKMIVGVFGEKMALISIPLACGIIAYGGVSVFVASFAVFPIAIEVFKEADLPRRFIPAALTFGCSTFAMVAPGAPQIHNAIPAQALGTDLMAGTVVGFISCGFILLMGAFILYGMVYKAKSRGEHFIAKHVDNFKDDINLPSGIMALIPLIITIILINFKVGGKPLLPLETGVFAGSVLVFIILNKYQDNEKILNNVGEACKTSIFSISNTCAVVGFGAVVKASLAFPIVVDAMVNIPGPEFVGIAVGTTVIAGITGSASGGLGIAAPLLGPVYLAKGVAAGAIHRTMSISSAALDSLPHNGYIVTVTNGLCNETHKDAYAPIFWLTVFTPAVGTVVAVILFSIFSALG